MYERRLLELLSIGELHMLLSLEIGLGHDAAASQIADRILSVITDQRRLRIAARALASQRKP